MSGDIASKQASGLFDCLPAFAGKGGIGVLAGSGLRCGFFNCPVDDLNKWSTAASICWGVLRF